MWVVNVNGEPVWETVVGNVVLRARSGQQLQQAIKEALGRTDRASQ
jgi:hypothetical protein